MSYKHIRFSDHFNGLFKLESTSIVVMEPIEKVSAGAAIMDGMRGNGNSRLKPRFHEGNGPSVTSISPILTLIHEQDHLKMLSSTPVGLLLWRMEQCLSVDAFYLQRNLPETTQQAHATMLDAWLEAAESLGDKVDKREVIMRTARGAMITRLFVALLLMRSNVTVGQFIEIANLAFGYIAERSGLAHDAHPRWASNLSPDQLLLPPEKHTLIEIIEASARARELTNLKGIDASQQTIEAWRKFAIFDVYKPAFTELMRELGCPSWTKTAIDLALSTPIDLSCGTDCDVLLVENVLPAYRLPRIVEGLRQRTWNINSAESDLRTELYTNMPHSIGLESVSEMYRRLSNARISLQANWGGKIYFSGEDSTDNQSLDDFLNEHSQELEAFSSFLNGETHLKFVESQYLRNFLLRAEDPTHFITSQPATLHEPILTFYSDCLVVCHAHIAQNVGLAFSAFWHFRDRIISRTYVYGDNDNGLLEFERLFILWAVKQGLPEQFVILLIQFVSRHRTAAAPRSLSELSEVFDCLRPARITLFPEENS
jgi:hypothetical protein